ncbi:MAG: hypothetical protein P8Y53_10235, partial [Pseudolabrys sp.]
ARVRCTRGMRAGRSWLRHEIGEDGSDKTRMRDWLQARRHSDADLELILSRLKIERIARAGGIGPPASLTMRGGRGKGMLRSARCM